MEADEARCRAHVDDSTALVTALVPALGYERCCLVAKKAKESGKSIRQVILDEGLLTLDQFNALVAPEAVTRLGS
jgi:aspartate ammonia-lyase